MGYGIIFTIKQNTFLTKHYRVTTLNGVETIIVTCTFTECVLQTLSIETFLHTNHRRGCMTERTTHQESNFSNVDDELPIASTSSSVSSLTNFNGVNDTSI